jgi:hypothetical protein
MANDELEELFEEFEEDKGKRKNELISSDPMLENFARSPSIKRGRSISKPG